MISFIDIKLIVLKSCLYLFSPKSTYNCEGSDAFPDIVYWLFFPYVDDDDDDDSGWSIILGGNKIATKK